MIVVKEIWAANNVELQKELNELAGRIISITPQRDDYYQIVYEED